MRVVAFFVVGAAVAFLVAPFLVKLFLKFVRDASGVPAEPEGKHVPGWITGTFERLLAFSLVLALSRNPELVVAILLAWMGAKLAANWQRQPFKGNGGAAEQKLRVYSISALMAGTLSISLGVLGGVIARHGPMLLGQLRHAVKALAG